MAVAVAGRDEGAMRVGFTGTSQGMTRPQQEAVAALLLDPVPNEAHHGNCVGADAEFHAALLLKRRSA